MRLKFISQELFTTRALKVSAAEGRNSAQVKSRRVESCHPGRQDYITPRQTEIFSMADASKAIRLPKPIAYKKLLAAHTNACSLDLKLGEVNILIYSFSVDNLCITETWLNYDVTDAEVTLEK